MRKKRKNLIQVQIRKNTDGKSAEISSERLDPYEEDKAGKNEQNPGDSLFNGKRIRKRTG